MAQIEGDPALISMISELMFEMHVGGRAAVRAGVHGTCGRMWVWVCVSLGGSQAGH